MNLKFSISVLLVLSSLSVYTQDCTCSEKYDSEAERINLVNSKNQFCRAEGLYGYARKYILNYQPDSSEIFANQSIEILEKEKCTSNTLLDSYKILANVFYYQNDFEKQIQISFKINKLLIDRNDTVDIALGLMNLSILFNDINQCKKGMVYIYQALPYINKVKNPVSKSELYIKLAKCYINANESIKNDLYLDTAFKYVTEAQKSINLQIDKRLQLLIWNRFSTILAAQRNHKERLRYIDSTLKYCNRKEDVQELAAIYIQKTEALLALRQFENIDKVIDSSIYFSKILNSPLQLSQTYKNVYLVAKAKKNLEKALNYLEMQKSIGDSLNLAETTQKVSELEEKYNQSKNENTIKELSFSNELFKLRQQLLLAILVALVLISISIFVFFKQRQIRNRFSLLEANLRLEQTKLNPHFIFNTLASLQNLALQAEPSKTANFIAKYAKNIRQVLESSYNDMVSIEDEKEFIESYLDLQKLRYADKFDYNIFIDEKVFLEKTQVPPMLLQPFLENAIEHGFRNIDYKGLIKVYFKKEEDFQIIIEDNGKPENTKEPNKYPSRATQITNDRLLLLNEKYKIKWEFKVEIVLEKDINYRITITLKV